MSEFRSVAAQAYREDFACRDDDALQQLLNQLYDYQDDIETKVLHRCRLNLFHRLMRDLIARGVVTSFGSALDIGCNAGYYSKMIADFGFKKVVGVDIVDEYVQRARKHFGCADADRTLEFHTMNAEELDTSQRFDFILCTEVIEHTSHPERVVENIKAMLGPGGVAVVTLPNAVSLPYLWARMTHAVKRKAMDPVLRDHLRYPFHRATRLFRGSELRLVGTTGTNLILFGPVLKAVYQRPGFSWLNRLSFMMARAWPVKYVSQFFFLALKRGMQR